MGWLHENQAITTAVFNTKLQGAPKKVIPKEKFDISGIVVNFSPNLQSLQRRIQTIYPANFIGIIGCTRKL